MDDLNTSLDITSPTKRNAKLDEHGFVVIEDDESTLDNNNNNSNNNNDKLVEETPKEAGKRLSREQKWIHIANNWNDYMINQPEKLLNLSAKGIPTNLRPIIWKKMLNINFYKNQYPEDYFIELCKKSENEHTEQIDLDIPRTFPNNKRFFTKRSKKDLLNVLQSYSYHNSKVGYCQGMSYIAGVLLMFLSVEDSFWALVALLERETMGYYIPGMPQLISDSILFQKILEIENQSLGIHLTKNGMDPLLYVTPWWMCFFTTLPEWGYVMRMWDVVLFEGINSLFRISIVILKYSAGYLFKKKGADGLLPYLLRPPLDEIGGIDFLLKMALELPIKDLVHQAKLRIEQEREEKLIAQKLKEQEKELIREQEELAKQQEMILQQQQAKKKQLGESGVFDRIIKTFIEDDSSGSSNEANGIKLTTKSSTTPSSPPPTPLKTPVKAQSSSFLSKRLHDLSNRIKSRFAPSNGYQPCNVIHESKKPRKSVARRPSMAPRNSIAPRSTTMAPRNSIAPRARKSVLPKQINNETSNTKTTTTTTTTTTTSTNDIQDNNDSKPITKIEKSIEKDSNNNNNNNSNNNENILVKKPRQSFVTRRSILGRKSVLARKSVSNRQRYLIRNNNNNFVNPVFEPVLNDPLSIKEEEEEIKPNPFKKSTFDSAPPSSPIPMIKPPPPSSTPLLKIISPCNISLSSSQSFNQHYNHHINHNSSMNDSMLSNHTNNNNTSIRSSIGGSPLRKSIYKGSPLKTPPRSITKSVELMKEIMKTPPPPIPFNTTSPIKKSLKSGSKGNAAWVTHQMFENFSLHSPQQQSSPTVDEKAFLREFSTPTPLKDFNNRQHITGATPTTPMSTNPKKRLLFNNNGTENQTPNLKSNSKTSQSQQQHNKKIKQQKPIEFSLESAIQEYNVEDQTELKEMSHQNYLFKKERKQWDLRV
ncbi:hypothetical protein CYY_006591 [Polysphondylium violaceum]|uniref:Rab-GAP TBC domain-containing protein n=1 Tax=Polysphondylium violaceum TaxID=133409 RepID=A0A8J4V2Z7_9MYCE|nr:hypothetical protein CYY_006591 [Polysphondylium violaceum]